MNESEKWANKGKLLVCDEYKELCFFFLLNGQSPLKAHILHKPTNLGQICFVAY